MAWGLPDRKTPGSDSGDVAAPGALDVNAQWRALLVERRYRALAAWQRSGYRDRAAYAEAGACDDRLRQHREALNFRRLMEGRHG